MQVRRQRVREAHKTRAHWQARLAEVTAEEMQLRPVVDKLEGGGPTQDLASQCHS